MTARSSTTRAWHSSLAAIVKLLRLSGEIRVDQRYESVGRDRAAHPALVEVCGRLGGDDLFQGLPGAEQAAILGLVFGTIFAITGRIWMVMFAHAAFDVIAVLIIYWNLESYVAHLVFK